MKFCVCQHDMPCTLEIYSKGFKPATLLKKSLWHRCFPVNFGKLSRTPFCYRTPLGDCFCASLKWYVWHSPYISFGTYHCRTNAYKYWLFPYTIQERDKLDFQLQMHIQNPNIHLR